MTGRSRRVLKSFAATALDRSGLANLFSMRKSGKMPLVVGYHRVVDDFEVEAGGYIPSMLISAKTFERHLDWIGKEYEFADPDLMGRWLNGEHPSSGKRVAVITFDDGYRDVYDHALPILKRKGIPAVIFAVTDLVGTEDLQVHDALYLALGGVLAKVSRRELSWRALFKEAGLDLPSGTATDLFTCDVYALMRVLFTTLPQPSLRAMIAALERHSEVTHEIPSGMKMLTWWMLAEMQAAGMTVGSHTASHALLTNEEDDVVASELCESQRALTKNLGVRVRHFAYPDGRFDARVTRAVLDAGYQYAYSICQHRDPAQRNLTIPRRILWENACVNSAGGFSSSIMRCQVSGLFDLFAPCRMNHAYQKPLAQESGRISDAV